MVRRLPFLRPTAARSSDRAIGETSLLIPTRAARFLAALLLPLTFAASAGAQSPAPHRPAATRPAPVGGAIQAIKVEGSQRIEEGTIRSYMLVRAGDSFDQDRIDRSLKVLFATGLFQDVRITRDGAVLTVHLIENPIVNRVVFEGNHKLTDDQLTRQVGPWPEIRVG